MRHDAQEEQKQSHRAQSMDYYDGSYAKICETLTRPAAERTLCEKAIIQFGGLLRVACRAEFGLLSWHRTIEKQ